MAVVIRLSRMGKKGERKFRVVVTEKRSRRDGAPVDMLGWYVKGPKGGKKDINKERYQYWLEKGAQPSPTVADLMK
jgi:small subunit ribosomal protein S16